VPVAIVLADVGLGRAHEHTPTVSFAESVSAPLANVGFAAKYWLDFRLRQSVHANDDVVAVAPERMRA